MNSLTSSVTSRTFDIRPDEDASVLEHDMARLVRGYGIAVRNDDDELDVVFDQGGLIAALDSVEMARRRLVAQECSLVGLMDHDELFGADGHRSARGVLFSELGWSQAEYNQRIPIARASVEYPMIIMALSDGRLPVGHATLLSRHVLNTGVSERPDFEYELRRWISRAEVWEYEHFKLKLAEWGKVIEPDTAEAVAKRQRENRAAYIFRDKDGMIGLSAKFDPLTGARMAQHLAAQIDVEFNEDWKQVSPSGEASTLIVTTLPRTDAQRACDALEKLVCGKTATSSGGEVLIVVDQQTIQQEMLRLHLDGKTPDSMIPEDFNGPLFVPDEPPVESRFCRTSNGTPIAPTTAVGEMMQGAFRFVMIDELNRPLSTSSKQRNFTGTMRKTIAAMSERCIWPGCREPAQRCQTDHNHETHQSGQTTYDNASGLMCGYHNRYKHQNNITINHSPNHTIQLKHSNRSE